MAYIPQFEVGVPLVVLVLIWTGAAASSGLVHMDELNP